MYIQRLSIEGFSGFEQSGWIEFSPKINVVIGTNNSGKSALLRAASGSIPNNPHKCPTRYLPGDLGTQRVHLELASTRAEFLRRLAAQNTPVRTWLSGPSVADVNQLKADLEKSETLKLHVEVRPGENVKNRKPTFRPISDNNVHVGNISLKEGSIVVSSGGAGKRDTTVDIYMNNSDPAIFYFPAERYHRPTTGFGRYDRLEGNAANLAGFLQYLQGNDFQKFEEITARLSQVIPSVERVTIDTLGDGFSLLIWPNGSGSNRELAFSLEACGTGVSQVLAIFTAVITKSESCIIVDEINSFLHPLAVKDLLSILASEYPTNQYIISSHSSDVVSHPSVSSVIVVERDEFVSKVKTLDRDDLASLKTHMRELGVSMGDVLGADSLLWVEGPTESIAFPNLIRDYLGGMPRGMQVVAVSSTGDFEGSVRTKKAVLKVYERFMEVAAPLATGQAFLLDREGLTDASISQIETSTDRKLKFLTRRCLENFVLDPSAIAELLSRDPEFLNDISESAIAEIMSTLAQSEDLRGHRAFKGDLKEKSWLEQVDGARLLSRMFRALSENTFEYRKAIHTPILLSLVDQESLKDLLSTLNERTKFALRS